MKKTLIFAGAALLTLAACNKTQTVEMQNPQDAPTISFKAVTSPATKTPTNPQLTETTLGTDNKLVRMYVSATSKDANGTVVKGDFFVNQHFSYITALWQPSDLADSSTETPHLLAFRRCYIGLPCIGMV